MLNSMTNNSREVGRVGLKKKKTNGKIKLQFFEGFFFRIAPGTDRQLPLQSCPVGLTHPWVGSWGAVFDASSRKKRRSNAYDGDSLFGVESPEEEKEIGMELDQPRSDWDL